MRAYHGRVRTRQGLFTATVGFALTACPQGSPEQAGQARTSEAPAQPARTEPARAEPVKAEPVKTEPARVETLARVREDVALPLPALLGQPAEPALAKLGEKQGAAMIKKTCVRYVPERVFFACSYAMQRYADPTGTFKGVTVELEDGLIASAAFDGWTKGTGPVEPAPLLAAIGLELPEPPEVDAPAEGVRRWRWFNHLARLRIGGKQYRVEMSAAGDAWERTRIEVVLNEPLTEPQRAKLVPVKQSSEP